MSGIRRKRINFESALYSFCIKHFFHIAIDCGLLRWFKTTAFRFVLVGMSPLEIFEKLTPAAPHSLSLITAILNSHILASKRTSLEV